MKTNPFSCLKCHIHHLQLCLLVQGIQWRHWKDEEQQSVRYFHGPQQAPTNVPHLQKLRQLHFLFTCCVSVTPKHLISCHSNAKKPAPVKIRHMPTWDGSDLDQKPWLYRLLPHAFLLPFCLWINTASKCLPPCSLTRSLLKLHWKLTMRMDNKDQMNNA